MPYTEVSDHSVRDSMTSTEPATSSTASSRRSSRVRFALDQEQPATVETRLRASSLKSSGSNRTLHGRPRFQHDDDKYSLGSYRHPYEIPRPPDAHDTFHTPSPLVPSPSDEASGDIKESNSSNVDLENGYFPELDHDEDGEDGSAPIEDGGPLSYLVDGDEDNNWDNLDAQQPSDDEGEEADTLYEHVIDDDDPVVTGKKKQYLEDYEDLEELVQEQMNYKERRKAARAVKIQYNISCAFSSES